MDRLAEAVADLNGAAGHGGRGQEDQAWGDEALGKEG
jgi:hypothetical protein